MRRNTLKEAKNIMIEIDKIRGMMIRLDPDTFSGQQREFELCQLIFMYQADIETLLRREMMQTENKDVVMNLNTKKAA